MKQRRCNERWIGLSLLATSLLSARAIHVLMASQVSSQDEIRVDNADCLKISLVRCILHFLSRTAAGSHWSLAGCLWA